MSTDPSPPSSEPPPGSGPPPGSEPSEGQPHLTLAGRIGADWAAVIVAAALVALALSGALPAIPFIVR